MQENDFHACTLRICSFLSGVLQVGNLIIILIERLTRLLQLSFHTQKFLHTTKLVRVATQSKTEVIHLDLLASRIGRVLRRAVAHFKDKIGHDLIENTNGFRKRFGWEGRMRAWVSVGEKKEAYFIETVSISIKIRQVERSTYAQMESSSGPCASQHAPWVPPSSFFYYYYYYL